VKRRRIASGSTFERAFADSRPAATMIEAGLAEERILIEIEVTALRPE
jgi:enamine deaminase RidA (YjgF/YER057c/UK114 family)